MASREGDWMGGMSMKLKVDWKTIIATNAIRHLEKRGSLGLGMEGCVIMRQLSGWCE